LIDLAEGEAPRTEQLPPKSELPVVAAPLTQHSIAATATVPAVNGTEEGVGTEKPKAQTMAQRAIVKSEALKATITHRPKVCRTPAVHLCLSIAGYWQCRRRPRRSEL